MRQLLLLPLIVLILSCNMSQKEGKNERQNVLDTLAIKNNIYYSLVEIDKGYIKFGHGIRYLDILGFKYTVVNEKGKLESREICDSLRLQLIGRAVLSNEFNNLLTINYSNKVGAFRKNISDPINLGFLMTKHELGKTLLDILTKRGDFNYGYKFHNEYGHYGSNDFGDEFMPDQDIVEYHLEKIHIVNDSMAVYKNSDIELSFEENFDMLYFILVKDNSRNIWLLDDIVICSKEEEEEYDIKLIGEPKPITFYTAKYYE